MNKFVRSKTIFLQITCIFCLIVIGNAVAREDIDLEKRITALEERVKKLEMRLNEALSLIKQVEEISAKLETEKITSPIEAKLFKKELKMAESGEEDDNLALLIMFENTGSVDVKSFKGEMIFRDEYGDKIMNFYANINKSIPVDKSNTWFGGIPYDTANEGHKKLLNMDIDNIKVEIRLEEIVFSDGTIKSIKK